MPNIETVGVVFQAQVGQAQAQIQNFAQNSKKQLDTLTTSSDKLVQSFIKYQLGYKAFFALTGAIRDAASAQIDFNQKIAEVSTLFTQTNVDMSTFVTMSRTLAMTYGTLPADQAAAFYWIVSSGAVQAADAINVLTAANNLALGGLTSVETAADGLTTILNAYHMNAGHSTEISDQLFAAMRVGKTTIDQLSRSFGTVAQTAYEAGVNTKELIGTMTALTTVGISTREAQTALNQLIRQFFKPNKEAQEVIARLGLEMSTTAIQTKGWQQALMDVAGDARLTSEDMVTLAGSVRSFKAFAALAANGGEALAKGLRAVEEASNDAEIAAEKMRTTWFETKALGTGLITVFGALGESLTSSADMTTKALTPFNSLKDLLKWMRQNLAYNTQAITGEVQERGRLLDVLWKEENSVKRLVKARANLDDLVNTGRISEDEYVRQMSVATAQLAAHQSAMDETRFKYLQLKQATDDLTASEKAFLKVYNARKTAVADTQKELTTRQQLYEQLTVLENATLAETEAKYRETSVQKLEILREQLAQEKKAKDEAAAERAKEVEKERERESKNIERALRNMAIAYAEQQLARKNLTREDITAIAWLEKLAAAYKKVRAAQQRSPADARALDEYTNDIKANTKLIQKDNEENEREAEERSERNRKRMVQEVVDVSKTYRRRLALAQKTTDALIKQEDEQYQESQKLAAALASPFQDMAREAIVNGKVTEEFVKQMFARIAANLVASGILTLLMSIFGAFTGGSTFAVSGLLTGGSFLKPKARGGMAEDSGMWLHAARGLVVPNTGTDRDVYPTLLRRGEQVLTPEERRGGMGSPINISAPMQLVTAPPNSAAIRRHFRDSVVPAVTKVTDSRASVKFRRVVGT